MLSEQTKYKFHLQVDTKLDCLKDVLIWFESKVSPSLPQKEAWQCEVALAEAFTNAVRHAHEDLPASTPIDLEIELFPSFLEIKVCDCGKPFDLEAQLLAHEEDLNSVEKEGGRGLQFIKKLTDELQYLNLSDYRNCLVIRKNY
jgi:serine/threonine-protein kinase RsbW